MAYDRELSRELALLEEDFGRWRRADIDVHELAARMHRFHQGPGRQLHSIYVNGDLEMVVGAAIGKGILSEDEAGGEIVHLLKSWIDLAREGFGSTPSKGVGGSHGGDEPD